MTTAAVLLAAVLALQSAEPRGSISGRFLSAQTGEPLKGVSVETWVAIDGQRQPRSAVSGADGSFAFPGLPPGTYYLTAQKSGYRHAGSRVLPVAVAKDQERSGVEIRLHRASVITGRVSDPDGAPVTGAEIAASRFLWKDGRRVLDLAGAATTDDRGIYRLIGLAAGRYVMAAGLPPVERPAGEADLSRARSFYPSGHRPSEAAPLDLAWGQELTEINLVLRPEAAYSISGVVADAEAAGPCRVCTVRVARVGEIDDLAHRRFSVAPDGSYRVWGLVAGAYRVIAETQTAGKGRRASRLVHITDTSPDDAHLIVAAGLDVAGRMVFDPEPPRGKLPQIEIDFRPVEDSAAASVARLAPDFTFHLSGLPPDTYRVDIENLPLGGYVKALRLAGRDLPAPELELAEPGVPGPLEAVVAFDSATVAGTVQRAGSLRVAILLVAQDETARFLSRRLENADADGSFILTGIAPGDYRIFALPRSESDEWPDPEVLRSLQAKSLSLRPKQRETIELPLAAP